MKTHLTERFAKSVQPQGPRDLLIFDDDVAGFGLCVYASGIRAFVLSYRIAGRKRRITIGSWPDCARELLKSEKETRASVAALLNVDVATLRRALGQFTEKK